MAYITFADIIRPVAKKQALEYDFILVVLGSLFIALTAQITITLSLVPITGQTFGILLIAAMFGRYRGTASVLLYLSEGAMGLPVLAGATGGWIHFVGPTGGYLIGFIGAAYVVGLLSEKGWDRRFTTTILAMLLGNSVVYLFGLLWLTRFVDDVFITGLNPFILGDTLKLLLATLLLPSGWKLLALSKGKSESI